MYLLAPFILQDFKKIFRPIQSYEDMQFSGSKMALFVMNKFFLVKTIIITFIYLSALFIVQNLKKFLQRIQIYEYVPFLGPRWSVSPNNFFF